MAQGASLLLHSNRGELPIVQVVRHIHIATVRIFGFLNLMGLSWNLLKTPAYINRNEKSKPQSKSSSNVAPIFAQPLVLALNFLQHFFF